LNERRRRRRSREGNIPDTRSDRCEQNHGDRVEWEDCVERKRYRAEDEFSQMNEDESKRKTTNLRRKKKRAAERESTSTR
jgi:hypothetical protein